MRRYKSSKCLTEPWTITVIQMSVGKIITCAILDGNGNYTSQPHCVHISSLVSLLCTVYPHHKTSHQSKGALKQ